MSRVQTIEDRRGMSPKMAMGGGGGLLMILVVLALGFLGAPPAAQQIAGNIVNQVQQRNAECGCGCGCFR